MIRPGNEFWAQQDYYRDTAENYDQQHGVDEIEYSLFVLDGYLRRKSITTLLDIGSGTGRALLQIMQSHPGMDLRGIEPNERMREIAHRKGLSPSILTYGDANSLDFADNSFDVVTAFGVLHHVRQPDVVVREMIRVARRAIFISDTNNWGQGSLGARFAKSILRRLRLWKIFIYISTGGRVHKSSKGDGIFYSFSLYDILPLIGSKFPKIYIMNSDVPGIIYNGRFEAPGLCVLATRDQP